MKTRIRQARLSTVVFASLLVSRSLSAQVVTGTVTARTGVALPEVQIQAEIRSLKGTSPTDSQGRFKVDAATMFSASELRDARGLMLMFSKSGFQPVNRFVPLPARPEDLDVNVQLDQSAGRALSDAEKRSLDPYVPAPGNESLFLIPYSIDGLAEAESRRVTDFLRRNLERLVTTHIQASDGASALVAVKVLPESLPTDLDRMRSVGVYLEALGMISGQGAADAGGSRTLGLSSTILVIPSLESFSPPVLYVEDDLPVKSLTSPRLYSKWSKLWGRSTLLAVGLKEFRKAQKAGDKKELTRIQSYLKAERASLGPGDELLISQLTTVLDALAKELAQ